MNPAEKAAVADPVLPELTETERKQVADFAEILSQLSRDGLASVLMFAEALASRKPEKLARVWWEECERLDRIDFGTDEAAADAAFAASVLPVEEALFSAPCRTAADVAAKVLIWHRGTDYAGESPAGELAPYTESLLDELRTLVGRQDRPAPVPVSLKVRASA